MHAAKRAREIGRCRGGFFRRCRASRLAQKNRVASPLPVSDQPRMLRVKELQDLLAARGVNLTEHRFSGFAQVQIVADKKRNDQPLNEQSVKTRATTPSRSDSKILAREIGEHPTAYLAIRSCRHPATHGGEFLLADNGSRRKFALERQSRN